MRKVCAVCVCTCDSVVKMAVVGRGGVRRQGGEKLCKNGGCTM